MSACMLWALVAFTLGAFPGWGHGAELKGASLEEERSPRKGDLGSIRLSRSTQHQKHWPTIYRTGSFSALSRGLVANVVSVQPAGPKRVAVGLGLKGDAGTEQSKDSPVSSIVDLLLRV